MPRKYSSVSTTTLRQESAGAGDAYPVLDFVPEQVPHHILIDAAREIPPKSLLIAVDFGTTFSAISYVALSAEEYGSSYIPPERIMSIKNFPEDWNSDSDDRMKNEVPTELMYPRDPKFRQQEGLVYQPRPYEPEDDDMDDDADGEMDIDVENLHVRGDLAGRASLGDGHIQPTSDRDANDIMAMYEPTDQFRWGYGVHELWSLPSAHLDRSNQAMARFKLLLDESQTTTDVRDRLRETLDTLKRRKIVKSSVDVIADYLTCLLRHARSELNNEGFDDSYTIEMILCVPAIWTQKACRDMQTALASAMANANFPGVDIRNNCIENLFIVSEPEAAAAYTLANDWQIKVCLPLSTQADHIEY
jgi:hypothetical protein